MTRHRNLFARATAVVALLAALGACTGSLLETKLPVPTSYVLLPAAKSGDTGIAAPAVDLTVTQASPAPGLNTERIAVLREARRMDYYMDAQWGAPLPLVVQSLLIGSLQNQSWFRSVTSEQARVNSNYWLELEVRDFQAEYASEDSAPTVRVTLVGALVRVKDRKLLGVYSATVTKAAAENRLGAVVTAFESAAQVASLSIGKQVAGGTQAQ